MESFQHNQVKLAVAVALEAAELGEAGPAGLARSTITGAPGCVGP